MCRRMRRSASAGSAVDKRFEGVGKAVRDVEPGLLGDFDEPGRAGHVYFGQEVAYDVQPDGSTTSAGEDETAGGGQGDRLAAGAGAGVEKEALHRGSQVADDEPLGWVLNLKPAFAESRQVGRLPDSDHQAGIEGGRAELDSLGAPGGLEIGPGPARRLDDQRGSGVVALEQPGGFFRAKARHPAID